MNMTPSCPTTIRQLTALLAPPYDQDEARDIVLLLLSEAFHLSLTDVACGALASLSPSDHKRLMEMMERLRQHEPVQYVLGKTTFCHRVFHVDKNVLIPRPETQSLCGLIVDEWDRPYCGLQPPEPIKVLDVGTGSGCIAVTLALSLPCSKVTGWDVSGNALLVARDNAHRLGAKVDWKLCDALSFARRERCSPVGRDSVQSSLYCRKRTKGHASECTWLRTRFGTFCSRCRSPAVLPCHSQLCSTLVAFARKNLF